MITRKFLIVCFISLLFLVSCNQKGLKDQYSNPKDQYLLYIEKIKPLKEYKIVYSELTNSYEDYEEIYVKNQKQKVIFTTNTSNATSWRYYLDDINFYCNNFNIFEDEGEIDCRRLHDLFDKFPQFGESYIKSTNVSVNYLGKFELIERKCDKFQVSDNRSSLDICMDQETGIPLSINFTRFDDIDSWSSSKTVTLLEMHVDDSEFKLPVDFIIFDSACGKKDIVVVIEAFNDIKGEIRLNNIWTLEKKIEKTYLSPIDNIKKGRTMLQFGIKNYSIFPRDYELCIGNDCKGFDCHDSDEGTECMKHTTEKLCKQDNVCIYYDGICHMFDCEFFEDEKTCEPKRCVWDYSYPRCRNKQCYDHQTKQECQNSHINCYWSYDGNSCYPFNCEMLNESACEADLGCKWVPSLDSCEMALI